MFTLLEAFHKLLNTLQYNAKREGLSQQVHIYTGQLSATDKLSLGLVHSSQAFLLENTRKAKNGRAALGRRAIDGPCAVMQRPSWGTPVCCLAARRATYGPYRPPLDEPFRRAKYGPSQMRRPDSSGLRPHYQGS